MGYFSHGYEQSGRRRKSPTEMFVRIVVIAVFVVVINRWFMNREAGRTSPAPESTRAVDSAVQSAIAQDLSPATRPALTDGIAAIILVDASGSMADRVKNADGQRVVKMDAARAAVVELVETTARLKAERLTLPVLLGVYEFADRGDGRNVRPVIPLGPPDPSAARAAVARMEPAGGTPIGRALARAKRDLDQAGMSRQHILVVTDGENTAGYTPDDVLSVMRESIEGVPATVYFVAFDVAAEKFAPIQALGGTVLPAADAGALRAALDGLLTERILVE